MARQTQHIIDCEQAFALAATPIGLRQTLRQRAIGGAATRIGNHLKAALRDQPCAGHIAQSCLFGGGMTAHHTGQRVAVGQTDGAITESGGGFDHFLRMRCAVQKTEIGDCRQLGKPRPAHGNTPCMNQRGLSLSRSYSPSR